MATFCVWFVGESAEVAAQGSRGYHFLKSFGMTRQGD